MLNVDVIEIDFLWLNKMYIYYATEDFEPNPIVQNVDVYMADTFDLWILNL